MKKIFFCILILLLTSTVAFHAKLDFENDDIISYEVNSKLQTLNFFWKNNKGNHIGSIHNLIKYVEAENKKLIFAMNGGMYRRDRSPQGLFVQDGEAYTVLDTNSGEGNFYMKPNGVFYITKDNNPFVCTTEKFIMNSTIKDATQSGPMLVIDGEIHPAFRKGSLNLNIRNGVGILADNKIVFAMSKKEINFYDFANYFKILGCKQALYLDGYVSRTYLPEKNWIQTDGNFGVIIGVVK